MMTWAPCPHGVRTRGKKDLLIGEEAQQDMDLKSAFAPAVLRQPFFRLPPTTWYMPASGP